MNRGTKKKLVLAVVAAAGLTSSSGLARGAAEFYDTSSTTGLQPGNGTWDAGTTALWSTGPLGTALTTWVNGNDAYFNVSATSGDTVAVNGAVSANSITVLATNTGSHVYGLTLQNAPVAVGSGGIVLNGVEEYYGLTSFVLDEKNGSGLTTTSVPLTFAGSGSFDLNAASGVSQSMGALSFNGGDGTVVDTNNGGTENLTFSSESRALGASANFTTSGGTNGTTNKIVLTGQAAGFIDQGTFFGGSAYAVYDAGGFVRAINYAAGNSDNAMQQAAGASGFTASYAGTNVQATGAISGITSGTISTLNTAYNLTLADSSEVLTLSSGGLLDNNGSVLISGGTIQAGLDKELVVRTNGTSSNLIISSTIGANGNNALTKTGYATLTLNAANAYTGGTYVSSGTLMAGTSGALGSGAITLYSGGVLSASAQTVTLNNNLIIGAGSNAYFGAGGFTLNGNISGGGFGGAGSSLTFSTGTFNLGGSTASTFAGTLYLDQTTHLTTLTAGDASAVWSTIDPAGPIDLDAGDGQTGTGTIHLGGVSGNLPINVGGAGKSGSTPFTYDIVLGEAGMAEVDSGTISGVAFSYNTFNIIMAGAGTQTLSATNSYTGTTTVESGTLIAGVSSPSGSAGAFGNNSAPITLGDGTTATSNLSATLLTSGAVTVGHAIIVSNNATGGAYTIGGSADVTSTFSGAITIDQPLTVVQVVNSGGNGALNITGGVKSANGTQTVTFTGPGAINVSTTAIADGTGTNYTAVAVSGGSIDFSASNTYSGATTVTGGTLTVDASTNTSATLSKTASVSVLGGAVLQLQNVAASSSTNMLNPAAAILLTTVNSVDPVIALNLNGNSQTVGGLFYNMAAQPDGLYGFNGATYTEPAGATVPETDFTGNGYFNVVPEPSSIALLSLAVPTLLSRRRRASRCSQNHAVSA